MSQSGSRSSGSVPRGWRAPCGPGVTVVASSLRWPIEEKRATLGGAGVTSTPRRHLHTLLLTTGEEPSDLTRVSLMPDDI